MTVSAGVRRGAGAATREPAPDPLRSALGPLRVVPTPRARPPSIPLAEAVRLAREERPAGARYVQDALAVDFSRASDEQVFGPQTTARADLPDPRQWAAHIGQAVVEVMAGARSAPQLVRWTTPEVYAVVARRGALAARRAAAGRSPQPRRAVVRRVLVCEPADGVAEASVIVLDGDRVRALAIRLVGLDGRWRVEALQVG